MPENNSNTINSIRRAVHLLSLYKDSKRYLGITEISRSMKLPKATVYRILNTLEEVEWLVKNPETGKYRLGFEILTMALSVRNQYEHKDIILKKMTELKQKINESVILSVFAKGHGICIERVDSDNQLRLMSLPGQLIPLHAGATGKVLLAFAPEDQAKAVLEGNLESYTALTPTNKELLSLQIAEIQKNGYAVSEGETDSGVSAIGVPIFDGRGNSIYGLSIAGPTERIREKGVGFLIGTLKDAAKQISSSLELLQ